MSGRIAAGGAWLAVLVLAFGCAGSGRQADTRQRAPTSAPETATWTDVPIRFSIH